MTNLTINELLNTIFIGAQKIHDAPKDGKNETARDIYQEDMYDIISLPEWNKTKDIPEITQIMEEIENTIKGPLSILFNSESNNMDKEYDKILDKILKDVKKCEGIIESMKRGNKR